MLLYFFLTFFKNAMEEKLSLFNYLHQLLALTKPVFTCTCMRTVMSFIRLAANVEIEVGVAKERKQHVREIALGKMTSSGTGKITTLRGSTIAKLAAIFPTSMKRVGCFCYVAATFPSLIYRA